MLRIPDSEGVVTMGIPEYTIVCGVDRKHLHQLSMTWPTWHRHKPSLLDNHMIVFYDRYQVTAEDVHGVCGHPWLETVPWPPTDMSKDSYGQGMRDGKWANPQRAMMLSGFVHVSHLVQTEYLLKLDTDMIATGCDDWIKADWFADSPAIVSQKWGFTKPANQILTLDSWASIDQFSEFNQAPLCLTPKAGAGRISHKRIISWCGFFRTDFVKTCSRLAEETCGRGKMPVPSQDGFLWYCAKRMGAGIVRVNVKSRGWLNRSTMHNIEQESLRAMA